MKWYKDLYVGESIAPDYKRIIKKIKYHKFTPDVYVISFASNPENLMDIIPSWQLIQPGYPKDALRIIGIAGGKAEAYELTRQMIEETYLMTGTVDVAMYLKGKWRDEQWK